MKTKQETIVHNKGIDTKLRYINVILGILGGLLIIWIFVIPFGTIFLSQFSQTNIVALVEFFTSPAFVKLYEAYTPQVIFTSVILLIIFQWYKGNLKESYLSMIDEERKIKELYINKLKPKLKILEKQRKNIVYNMVIAIVIAIVAFFVSFFLIIVLIGIIFYVLSFIINLESSFGGGYILMFSLFISMSIVFVTFNSLYRPYKKKFKAEIIGSIVTAIDKNLTYYPQREITYQEFQVTKLAEYLDTIDTLSGEDYVEGMLGKTAIKFSEINAARTEMDEHGNEYHVTVFNGLFFIFDFNKAFEGLTVVVPKGNYYWNSGELVKLESPKFEQEFSVYSDNQITARYILSPSLMQRILKFKQTSKKKLYLSFVDGKLYVAISISGDLFEPNVFSTLLDYEIYRDFFTNMSFAENIVEELNLNLRIWSKGSPSFDPTVVLRQNDLQGMIEK
ncbi:DUF3137 domain-containing protein [Candidatus Halobeggiatoa sp. HSG11]|nr:DUF3137 domain-containing protein [Candidatus Halobeggiatoa sp. HSG11]